MNQHVKDSTLDVLSIRKDFPILSREINGKPLVYLDNAATTQKPRVVIDRIKSLFENDYSNIHRGVHTLSQRSTALYEEARTTIRKFINASSDKEIIFNRGTTEGINLIAQTYGRKYLKVGDEILVSTLEHHSNIVPWQMLCESTGAILRVVPINLKGEILMDAYRSMLNSKTKIVSISHVSNSLGTINPITEMIEMAHRNGSIFVVDGAQAVSHMKVDVQKLDCDFYVFSGHKIYGPTGVGVLFGKQALLESIPPYQGGGDMIRTVSFEKTTYNDLPYKFEAGTPNIAGAIGLAAAIKYISTIGIDSIQAYEIELLTYATECLSKIKQVKLIGTAEKKASVVSFMIEGIHAHDVGTILDQEGVAIRAGHHCTQPLMDFYGIPATARASFAFYNTKEEIDVLIKGIHQTIKLFE